MGKKKKPFKLPKGATLLDPALSKDELIMALTSKLPENYEDIDDTKKRAIETVIANLNNGVGLRESCKNGGIADVTFYRYRQRYTWIQEAMDTINAARLQVVEDSLFKSATGYDYETIDQLVVEMVDKDGNRIGEQKRRMHKKTVHVPMSPTSAIFFLKNRSGGRWRSDHNITIESSHTERKEIALAAEVRHLVQEANTDDLRMLAEMGDRLTEEVRVRNGGAGTDTDKPEK